MIDKAVCEYKVIGCALSDLSTDAPPFAVVVLAQVEGKARLASYVISDWQTCQQFPPVAHESMQHFIGDLKHYASGDAAERFFHHLGTLGVGTVRLVQEGSRNGGVPDGEITALLGGSPYGTTEWSSLPIRSELEDAAP